jgi:hypothetical protein
MVRAVAPVAQNRMTRPFVNIPRSSPERRRRGALCDPRLADLCIGIGSGRLVSGLSGLLLVETTYSPGTSGAFFLSLFVYRREPGGQMRR